MFFRKNKLKQQFDEQLVGAIHSTRERWQQAKVIEELMDDYDEEAIIQCKIAESVHFYLFKEARIRKVNIR